jgi:hypothetical protein
MPSQRHLSFLLDDLCSSFGICLAPERRNALLAAPPSDATAFVEAVVRAEGLVLRAMDQRLLRQIDARVAAAFGRHHDHDA